MVCTYIYTMYMALTYIYVHIPHCHRRNRACSRLHGVNTCTYHVNIHTNKCTCHICGVNICTYRIHVHMYIHICIYTCKIHVESESGTAWPSSNFSISSISELPRLCRPSPPCYVNICTCHIYGVNICTYHIHIPTNICTCHIHGVNICPYHMHVQVPHCYRRS